MTVETVLFDLDGRFSTRWTTFAIASTTRWRPGSPAPLAGVRAPGGGRRRSKADRLRALPDGADKAQVEACLAAFRAHYGENMDNKTRPYPGVLPMLEALPAGASG